MGRKIRGEVEGKCEDGGMEPVGEWLDGGGPGGRAGSMCSGENCGCAVPAVAPSREEPLRSERYRH